MKDLASQPERSPHRGRGAGPAPARPAHEGTILTLQRSIGNRATVALLQTEHKPASAGSRRVQAQRQAAESATESSAPADYTLEEPRPEVSPHPAAAAHPARAASGEQEWASKNPDTGVTELTPDHLVLWNFDVGGAELRPQRRAALDRFAARLGIVFLSSETELAIAGHASRTGSAQQNDRLSIMRANAVFEYLLARGLAASVQSSATAAPTNHGSRA